MLIFIICQNTITYKQAFLAYTITAVLSIILYYLYSRAWGSVLKYMCTYIEDLQQVRKQLLGHSN